MTGSTAGDGTGATDLAAIRTALVPLCTSIGADGYTMTVESFHDGLLKVVIEAGADACAECLVSKDVIAQMIAITLPADAAVSAIDLVYPLDVH